MCLTTQRKMPILYTKRFKLVPWQFGDNQTKHLVEMMQDDKVMQYITGKAQTDQEVQESLTKLDSKNNINGLGYWMIYEGETCIGLVVLKAVPTVPNYDYQETGYWVKPAHWGKAVASEAAKRMIKYGFEVLNLPYIVAVVDAKNIGSIKSLNKAGLTHQGKINAYDEELLFYKVLNPENQAKPELKTERFTLIPWQNLLNQQSELQEMMQDPRVMKYIGNGQAKTNAEMAETKIRWAENIAQDLKSPLGNWLIYQDDACVGMAMLKPLPNEQDQNYIEVGYWLKPKHWGKKIAGEVATHLVEYAFNKLNLKQVVAVTHKDNIASQKSLKKAGLTRQANIIAYNQSLPFFKVINPNLNA